MDTESRYLRDIRDAIKGIAKRSGMDVSGNAKTKYLKEIADAIRENGGGKDGNDKVKQEMIDTGSDDPIVFSESLSTNTGFVGKSSHFTYSPGSKTVKLTDGPAIPNKEAKITPESETFLTKIKTDVDESTYDETRYSAKVSTASNGYGIQFIKSESTTSNPAGGPGPITVEKTLGYTEIRHNNIAITNIDNDPNTGFNRTMTLKDDDIVMGGETPNTWDGTNTSLKSALAAAKDGNNKVKQTPVNTGIFNLLLSNSYGDFEETSGAKKAVKLCYHAYNNRMENEGEYYSKSTEDNIEHGAFLNSNDVELYSQNQSRVPNTWDGVNTSLKAALAAAKDVMIVTFTPASGSVTKYDPFDCDTTLNDISAAIEAGRTVIGKIDWNNGTDSYHVLRLSHYGGRPIDTINFEGGEAAGIDQNNNLTYDMYMFTIGLLGVTNGTKTVALPITGGLT